MPIFEEIESGNTYTYLPSSASGIMTDQGCHLPAYWGKTMAKNLNSLVAKNRNFVIMSGNHADDDGTNANHDTDGFMVANGLSSTAEMTIRGRGWIPHPYKNIRYVIVGASDGGAYISSAEFTIYISDTPWPTTENDKRGKWTSKTFEIETTNIADTANSRVSGILYDVPVSADRTVYIYVVNQNVRLGSYCFYADGVQ